MFEKATRQKLRFDSPRGFLTVEDLWDLPLTSTVTNKPNLNDIAKAINKQLKASDEEDFVHVSSKADEVLQLQMEILKHIIAVRLAENEATKTAADRKAKKERLLEIIGKKQDQALENAPVEDLLKMVAEL